MEIENICLLCRAIQRTGNNTIMNLRKVYNIFIAVDQLQDVKQRILLWVIFVQTEF